KVSLDVGVEQPLQHFARRVLPVVDDVLVCCAGCDFPCELGRQQFALLRFAEGGKEIVEIERSPGISIFGEKRMFQLAAQGGSEQRRSRDFVAQSAPQKTWNHVAV